jgi:hypothetical protein
MDILSIFFYFLASFLYILWPNLRKIHGFSPKNGQFRAKFLKKNIEIYKRKHFLSNYLLDSCSNAILIATVHIVNNINAILNFFSSFLLDFDLKMGIFE